MRTKIYSIVTLIFLSIFYIQAQDVEQKLNEARTAYKNQKYDDARFALQQALTELDILLGKEVLAILPQKMGNLGFKIDDDQTTGSAAGFAGLYVFRVYGDSEGQKSAEISIIGDSPLLAGINAILSLPGIAMGDPNQKRIRVDGYKALLQKNENSEGKISYDVQVPFGNSLLTFQCEGFKTENEVTAMVNTISVSKIAELIR